MRFYKSRQSWLMVGGAPADAVWSAPIVVRHEPRGGLSNRRRPADRNSAYQRFMDTCRAASQLLGSLSPLLTANAKSVIGVQCSRKGWLFVFAL
ncbi:hypothetical protein T4B_13153 [Trichinella pseudospiralis]|nr:hypothetical protein T4B_13153 [Trichinella pseudospiralis]